MEIIGLTGRIGSGKSTIAKEIVKLVPNAKVTSFAGPVKTIAKTVFGWDGAKDERGRRLLQVIGTDAGRAYNQDIWVHMMQTQLGLLLAQGIPLVIIDDLRFDNEAEALKNRGGEIVRLTGRGGASGEIGAHASEQGITIPGVLEVENTTTPVETAFTVLHSVGLRHLIRRQHG